MQTAGWESSRTRRAHCTSQPLFYSHFFDPFTMSRVDGLGTFYPSQQPEWEHHTSSLPTTSNDFTVVFLSMQKNQGGKAICKACSQNPFPCKFTSRVFSICLQRMSDNKLLFHLLCWKTEQKTVPGVPTHPVPPAQLRQQPWLILHQHKPKSPGHAPVNPPFLGQFTIRSVRCPRDSRHPSPSAPGDSQAAPKHCTGYIY